MKYIIILLALISLALPQDTLKLKQSNVIYSGELMEISGDFVKFKSEGALFGNMIKLDKIDYLVSGNKILIENGVSEWSRKPTPSNAPDSTTMNTVESNTFNHEPNMAIRQTVAMESMAVSLRIIATISIISIVLLVVVAFAV